MHARHARYKRGLGPSLTPPHITRLRTSSGSAPNTAQHRYRLHVPLARCSGTRHNGTQVTSEHPHSHPALRWGSSQGYSLPGSRPAAPSDKAEEHYTCFLNRLPIVGCVTSSAPIRRVSNHLVMIKHNPNHIREVDLFTQNDSIIYKTSAVDYIKNEQSCSVKTHLPASVCAAIRAG